MSKANLPGLLPSPVPTGEVARAAGRRGCPRPAGRAAFPIEQAPSPLPSHVPYLDNNATTRPLPEAADAVRTALTEHWHNPSSVHRDGQAARHALEMARADLAALLGVTSRTLTFTGSGTESIDLAIRGVLGASSKNTLITARTEHAAVRDLAEHLEQTGQARVVWLDLEPIERGGTISLESLDAAIHAHAADTALVSVQWANNETGVIQPVAQIAERCQAAGVRFHCDAVQAAGKLPIDLPALAHAPDLLTVSPHKFHGPKGLGILHTRTGVRLRPTLQGSQELGRRGGTENVPAILGSAAAATAALEWLTGDAERARLAALRDRFERAVLDACPGAVVNGAHAPRLWNTTSIAFPRLEAEALLIAMSERGLAASAGAACSSGSLDPSPVLLAMGIAPELAHGSVRFSLSRFTTDAEIDEAIEITSAAVARLSRSSP